MNRTNILNLEGMLAVLLLILGVWMFGRCMEMIYEYCRHLLVESDQNLK